MPGNHTSSKRAFDERPFIVIWETTQACDLACVHCRASAQPWRSSQELTTAEAEGLIQEVRDMQAPLFVLTGGDPLKRPDIFELVEYSAKLGVRVSMTPSVTPFLTRDAIVKLQDAGLARLAVSLDGSRPEIHDAFRGVEGSYERTLETLRWAREIALPVQINTTITRRNLAGLDEMAALVETLGIVLWSVFFLVPTGRGRISDLISAEEFESVFRKLYEMSQRASFDIKTTEAQHYRRYIAQRRAEERRSNGAIPAVVAPLAQSSDGIGRAPRGINDGKGFVFISHKGEVYPSGFLPVTAGNIRERSLREIYLNSPLFVALRDTANLKGKCGVCEFREICGGSRARAFALAGDPFAEEPRCVYVPKGISIPA